MKHFKLPFRSSIILAGFAIATALTPAALFAEDCDPKTSDDYIQCVMNGVIVSGIWGRAGNDGGVEKLVEGRTNNLYSRLVNEFKVPNANLYTQGWNVNNPSNPNNSPSIDFLQRNLKNRLTALGKTKPSYLALVGHSFGGWASLAMSRTVGTPTPDLIFTIDPVIGPTNMANDEDRRGSAKLIVNFFQSSWVEFDGNYCLPQSIVPIPCVNGISCGVSVHSSAGQRPAFNTHLPYRAWADGSDIVDKCVAFDVNRPQSHTSIDDDRFVQAEATRLILEGVSYLKDVSEKNMVNGIIWSLGDKATTERLGFFTEADIKTKKSGQLRTDYRNFRMDQVFTKVLNRLPTAQERTWTLDFFKQGATALDLEISLLMSVDLIGAPGRTISLENIFYQWLKTGRNAEKVYEVLLGIDKTVYTYSWNDAAKTCNRTPRPLVVPNAKCGKAERQVIASGATCDVTYNGEYRFTLQAGQEDCPKIPAPMNGPIASGFYQIKNRFSQKCIDLKDASNKDGAKFQQLSCNRATNQAFNLNNISGDLYVMTIWSSQLCLSAENAGMDTGNSSVVQHGCNFLSEQNVRLLPSATPGAYLMQFENSSNCVDVVGMSRANNKGILQSTCSGEADQDWIFVSTDPFNNPTGTLATDVSYEIVGDFSQKCLDVKGDLGANGSSFQQWECSGTVDQRFRLLNAGDGLYKISNIASGKCLRTEAGKNDNGARMVLGDCNDDADQKIRLEPAANETFMLRFAHSNKCMDVEGTSKDNGKEVHQWDCSQSTPDQKWQLKDMGEGPVAPASDMTPTPSLQSMCIYMHKEDTKGGRKGETSFTDSMGNKKSCDRDGDWKTSCKDGDGKTDEVGCAKELPKPTATMCKYKHKKDTAGGKEDEITAFDFAGKQKSCDRNADWKTSCKDGNSDTDEVDCK